ncbi:MAG: hypothetical protein HY943_16700 [Gammaproteobacteria bacterium]|nr:hypothetical protein [Gammaproteobacteria bacterium]
MTSYLSNYVLLRASGADSAITSFVAQHLNGPCLSFESLRPTPAGLAADFPSDVEDAFDALYGDWTKVAGRHRFIEPARDLGRPFPLRSREDAIACHEALEPYGPEALARARVRHANIATHGAGDVATWCSRNWHADTDADRTVAAIAMDGLAVSFVLGSALSEKLVRLYSADYPELELDVRSALAIGKRAKLLRFGRGKKLAAKPPEAEGDVAREMFAFRRRHACAWLAQWIPAKLVARTIALDDRGDCFLQGTDVSVDFALSRMRAGTTPAGLQRQFPEITDAHAELLTAVAAATAVSARILGTGDLGKL